VTATGKDPKGEDVKDDAECTVTPAEAAAELSITKEADPSSDVGVDDEIIYTVVVTNSGNVTITDITLDDTLVDLDVDPFDLAPDESKTITYSYTVTQADVDNGQIDNTVTATGKDPKGGDVEGEAECTVTTEEPDPSLSVTKSADPSSDVAVDDEIVYTVVVTNDGNVTITDIELEDTLVTLSEDPFDLAPGASKTITYVYTVVQADVDAGSIENTVTATGKDPSDAEVTDDATATVTTVAPDASLSVTKTADPTSGVEADDTILYTVVVTNDGNVTITDIELEDTLVTLSETPFDLAPGASKTITIFTL
jgi:uncharacterized repeat protein (TIGR01451 family)